MDQEHSHITDSLKNEYFIQWVIKPTEESNYYWSKWLTAHPDRAQDVKSARNLLHSTRYSIDEYMPDDDYSEVLENLVNYNQAQKAKPRSAQIFFWKPLRIAASVLLVISIGFILLSYSKWISKEEPVASASITKFTKWGQKRTINLPDGSEVKLNSGSSLIYPERFEGITREVELIGEAFFSVRKNAEKPFIVKTKNLSTTVLGTSFSVSAYSYMPSTLVTLLEGKVNVEPIKGQASSSIELIELNPGEQAELNLTNGKFSKSEVDLKKFLAWKDGVLYFEREPLEKVFNRLSKWYGVEFEVSDQLLESKCKLDGEFDNESLEIVLKSISIVYGFEYEIDKNKNMIVIRGDTCE